MSSNEDVKVEDETIEIDEHFDGDDTEADGSDHSQIELTENLDSLEDVIGEDSEELLASEGDEDIAGEAQAADDIEALGESLDAMAAEDDEAAAGSDFDAEGTELESFESAEIEETEFLDSDQVQSIVESVLFATDKPQSISVIKQAFKGTNVKTKQIREALQQLAISYADPARGFTLEEVNSGFQLRTKVDNMDYLRGMMKARPFKLSGPALEVLSIVAYKQPTVKHEIDEIRGVESGHLLRALMEKSLVAFAGKTDLPGKPMSYQTTRRFLEIFGLRNLKELPSLAEIDDLIPEGIGDEEDKKSLGDMTEELSEDVKAASYSEGEEELGKITDQLSNINTSSDFFEQEKARLKAKKDAERAQDIRDALEVGEEVADKDKRWLERYDAAQAEEAERLVAEQEEAQNSSDTVSTEGEEGNSEQLITEAGADTTDLEAANSDSVQEISAELEALQAESSSEDKEESESGLEEPAAPGKNAVEAYMSEGVLTVEEMKQFSAELPELSDVAGEPEVDLDKALERFDAEGEQASSGEIGNVDVAELKADLAVFDEDESV